MILRVILGVDWISSLGFWGKLKKVVRRFGSVMRDVGGIGDCCACA